MTEYRNEKLIKELEKEVEENECGVSDCCWCFCCGIFGLVCIVPKYNARKLANDRLLLELAKPKRPQQANPPVQKQTSLDPSVQQQLEELRVLKEMQKQGQLAPAEPQSSFSPPPPTYNEKSS
ncbi:hypothetical protein HPULCUR_004249 [Helicostylum pulchrum]|uniref:Uncharacterized protein n=1 Tax=Helicostylum pulchrum TaxID=562976 RepID=A0ABP9XWQ0_9FUNG